MKAIIFNNPQWFLTILLMTISLSAFSQKEIVWKGGTPGMKNEWNCPQNWSTSSVPDEFSNVIIPDVSTSSYSSPIIRMGNVEINSIWIQSNASLTIEKGIDLIVFNYAEINARKNIHGEGNLVLQETSSERIPAMFVSRSN
jgi:hypothetical protein